MWRTLVVAFASIAVATSTVPAEALTPAPSLSTGSPVAAKLDSVGGGWREQGQSVHGWTLPLDARVKEAQGQRVAPRRPFELVGVSWIQGDPEVEVRTEKRGRWSPWSELHAAAEHGAPGLRAEHTSEPMWVGAVDAVAVRVTSDYRPGLRLVLVDSGERPADEPAVVARSVPAGTTDTGQDGQSDGSTSPATGATSPAAAPADGLVVAKAHPHKPKKHKAKKNKNKKKDKAKNKSSGKKHKAKKKSSGKKHKAKKKRSKTKKKAHQKAGKKKSFKSKKAKKKRAQAKKKSLKKAKKSCNRFKAKAKRVKCKKAKQRSMPNVAPMPRIYQRGAWGANGRWREGRPYRMTQIRQIHIHHTASSSSYRRRDVPGMIRGMYWYHTKKLGWSDIGYNFLVDKYGRIWEGRAGGVRKPIRGAHTLGFNHGSVGIASIGNHDRAPLRRKAMESIIKLAAWKLDANKQRPAGKIRVFSRGSDRFRDGKLVRLPVIAGHRATNQTACPGRKLAKRLPEIRRRAAIRANRFS